GAAEAGRVPGGRDAPRRFGRRPRRHRQADARGYLPRRRLPRPVGQEWPGRLEERQRRTAQWRTDKALAERRRTRAFRTVTPWPCARFPLEIKGFTLRRSLSASKGIT